MSEAQKVQELVVDAIAAKTAALDDFSADRPFALVPAGYTVENLEEFANYIDGRQPSPRKVDKRIRFVDVTSFLQYFEAFRIGHKPQLFHKVNAEGMHIMGVFDYDEPQGGEAPGTIVPTGTKPKWGDNISYLKLAYSRDYTQLRASADKWFKQDEFALFVEENLHLFIQPDGATMFELAQHLKGHRNVEWESGKRLNNSSTQLSYLETLDATTVRGEPLVVPDYLLLRLPLYEGFSDADVKLAFRWRLTQDKEINFSYRLLTKLAERTAENEVKQRIVGTTQLELLTVSTFNGLTPHNLD